MSFPRPHAIRAARYRARNQERALPETRDIDRAVVEALKDLLDQVGVRRPGDIDGLRNHTIRSLLAKVLVALESERFHVLEASGEARNRLWRRLGLRVKFERSS